MAFLLALSAGGVCLADRVSIPLEWNVRWGVHAECEFDISSGRFANAGLPLPDAIEATDASGKSRILPIRCLHGIGTNDVVYRFAVPEGTRSISAISSGNAGKVAFDDSSVCDNLFADALKSEKRWGGDAGTRAARTDGGMRLSCDIRDGKDHFAWVEVPVPDGVAGGPCRLEVDVKNVSEMTWPGLLKIRQLDADGNELPESLTDPRWTGHMRPPGLLTRYREDGYVHPQAKKIRALFGLRYLKSRFDNHGLPLTDNERLRPRLVVSHLAVRPAWHLPFPRYDSRHFAAGITDDPNDGAIRLGGKLAFQYQTRSQASWAEAIPMRQEDQIFFPMEAGTIEAWFRPNLRKGDENIYTLFQAIHHTSHVEPDSVYAKSSPSYAKGYLYTRGDVVCVEYEPAKGRVHVRLRDCEEKVFEADGKGTLPNGEWTHVAVVWEPDGNAELYIGGKSVMKLPLKGFKGYAEWLHNGLFPNDAGAVEFYLGSTFETARAEPKINPGKPIFPCAADLLRVSTGRRYGGSFVPQKDFAIDKDTRALFSFDRTFDGVSGGGIGFISGSYRSDRPRSTRRLTTSAGEVQYYPAENIAANDPDKILNTMNYPDLPTTADFRSMRRTVRRCFTSVPGEKIVVDCASEPITEFVEFKNVSSRPLMHPALINAGELDARSFGDLADSLGMSGAGERERVDRIYNFLLGASDYFMNHQPTYSPGSDTPQGVEYEALMMLNSYCGFECGPLNNLAANLFACAGGCPASQNDGYGHSFQSVYYGFKNHVYDMSARRLFPDFDNETIAGLREVDRETAVQTRFGGRIQQFLRLSTRRHNAQSPSYQPKMGMTLNPGEGFRLWRMNDGMVNDLQRNSCFRGNRRRIDRPLLPYQWDYSEITHSKCANGDDLHRIDRYFPDYGNGFLVFDGKPNVGNPAFCNVSDDSFCYSVRSCFPIVHGEYAAELSDDRHAVTEISTDNGRTFRPLSMDENGGTDYPVRARLAYLVKIKAPIKDVIRFRGVTEIQANRRVMTGLLHKGRNEMTFKATDGDKALVTVQYREKVREIEVEGAVHSGAIPGNERSLVLVDPVYSRTFKVHGVTAGTKVQGRGGIEARLDGGRMTISAKGVKSPGFGAVDIIDGDATKQLTVIVAPFARLAFPDKAEVRGEAAIAKADACRANASAILYTTNDCVRFRFAPLKAGKYVAIHLERYGSHVQKDKWSKDVNLFMPGFGAKVVAGSVANLAIDFYNCRYGRPGGRTNFKWDYPLEPKSEYPYALMRRLDIADGTDWAEYSLVRDFPGGVEIAAVLILRDPPQEFVCRIKKVLCGLNCEPWRVCAD